MYYLGFQRLIYHQIVLLNNLHKVANNEAQDSDSEISVTSSVSSLPSSKSLDEQIMIDDITIQEMPKNKEIPKQNTSTASPLNLLKFLYSKCSGHLGLPV